MIRWIENLERASRPALIGGGIAALALIGIIDYLTGYELMFSVFYLLEVGLATWYVGKWFGLLMSILSVGVWIGGDVAAGAHYSNPLVPIWNALILIVLYALVVWLYAELPARYRRLRAVDWWHKSDVTFSDAITAVRRYLWVEGVFALSGHREAFEKLGGPLRQILLQGLAPTA